MSLKRTTITLLAILALALIGAGAHAQVTILPSYYGGVYPIGPGIVPPVNYGLGASYGPTAIPRTNDMVAVRKLTRNRVWMGWQGNPSLVSRISFALLNRNGRVMAQRTITGPPAQMTLTRTRNSAYAQVLVTYIDGTVNTFVAPL